MRAGPDAPRQNKKKDDPMKRILLSILALTMTLSLSACFEETAAQKAQKKQVAGQMSVKVKAVESVPAPVIDNYQAREAVAKFMNRVNQKGQVWYVYKESRATGEILKAYTSSIYPMSVCSFMTPTEEIQRPSSGVSQYVVTSAIALDGLYYKGGECPTFFFDLTTDTLVVIDQDAVVSAYDQPLDVDVEITTFRKDTLSES
jgi:streptogramin lyase